MRQDLAQYEWLNWVKPLKLCVMLDATIFIASMGRRRSGWFQFSLHNHYLSQVLKKMPCLLILLILVFFGFFKCSKRFLGLGVC